MGSRIQDFRINILAMDIGAGTQDIMLYDDSFETAYRLVMPAPTVILARRIAGYTREKKDLVMVGETMGGGPINRAIDDHVKAGLRVYSTEIAARTISDDPEEVRKFGVRIVTPEKAMSLTQGESTGGILTRDVDRDALSTTCSMYNLQLDPKVVAVAVEDHGAAEAGQSDREYRFSQFRKAIPAGIEKFAYVKPPRHFTRMCGVKRTLERNFPKSNHLIMDTKIAAVFGGAGAAGRKSAVVVDIGNEHTAIAAIEDGKLIGILEHHTGMLDAKRLEEYITRFCRGDVDDCKVRLEGGHGSVMAGTIKSLDIIATGPRRGILSETGLKINYVNPGGDVFMTGNFGLVEAVKKVYRGKHFKNDE